MGSLMGSARAIAPTAKRSPAADSARLAVGIGTLVIVTLHGRSGKIDSLFKAFEQYIMTPGRSTAIVGD
jgi:hypothetical protein